MKKMVKIVMVVGLLVILTGVAQAAPEDWGPDTGYPTIDAWRRAGRQNDREAWERYYNANDRHHYGYPNGYYSNGNYPYGYSQQPSISITIPLPRPPWMR